MVVSAINFNKKLYLAGLAVIVFALAIFANLVFSQVTHAATFEVTNTNPDGAGSFVQAMADANAAGGHDTITFNIPGPGPHTIQYSRDNGTQIFGIPPITGPITVDGCTQPGSDCGSQVPELMIELDGSYTGTVQNNYIAANAVPFYSSGTAASGSTIRGLMINRVASQGCFLGTCSFTPQPAIQMSGDDITIESNILGTDNEGTPGIGNSRGIHLWHPSNNIVIRNNVIAGNTEDGMNAAFRVSPLPQQYVQDVTVTGNHIGVAPDGTPLGNEQAGIGLATCSYNWQIGGLAPGEANIIAYNGTGGIFAGRTNSSCDAGYEMLFNIQGNVIRDNTGNGVTIFQSTDGDSTYAVTVRQNSIFGNDGLGIDLADDGVTPNGPAGETREGPNHLVNYPTITAAYKGSLIVEGTYEGPANQTFTLDFYMNETADPSGNGEGQTWVGSGQVTTNGSGVATFSFTFDVDVPEGWHISATATSADGSTSEFSGDLVFPTLPGSLTPSGNPDGELADTGQNKLLLTTFAFMLLFAPAAIIFRHRLVGLAKR